MFAGHWLYQAGSPLTQAINASARTLRVRDASRFAVGQYVVIYDAPAGSFRNAEHARVSGRNLSTNTLTLASRGFKSNPRSHGVGAIVAQHVLGQGTNPQLWAFNMTTQSPRDGAGRTFAQFYADWLAKNLSRYKDGRESGVNIAGIVFDADVYFELKNADANNDLIRDDSMSPGGANWQGEGLDRFYAMVRARLPNKYILTGHYLGRGFAATNGTQMESWIDFGNGDFSGFPKYRNLNSMFSIYLYNMGESRAAPLVHNLTKTATRLYPGRENPPPPNNRAARLGLALTLMGNGYFGTHTRFTPDAWWDEYAVNVTPGSSTYGEAISKFSTEAIRQHRGWLGQPLGTFRRIYNDADFALSKSKLANGTFESGVSGWTGNRVNLSRITSAFDGTGALRASALTTVTKSLSGAQIKGPRVALQAGQQYTLAFAARASKAREIRVNLGSLNERFVVGPDWRRYVMSFQQSGSRTAPLIIAVGRESTTVDIDSVYVFQGNVNVFRRDFQHGIVLANATPTTRTINLGGTFQRIKGSQDPAVNNGQKVTSVTLPPYDGLLLVRPEGSNAGEATKPSDGASASIGDRVWTDADRDGIQDRSENGRGNVRVDLLSCRSTTAIRSTRTSSSGAFRFENLAAGSYRLRFVAPAGMSFSPPYRGDSRGRDSNADRSSGITECLSMTDSKARPGIDAGLMP